MKRLILLLVFGVFTGSAQTLTCGFQFIGSGTIGSQAFTNSEIVISTVGLTADVVGSIAAGSISLTNQSASIWIAGAGTFQINEPAGISVQIAPIGAASGTSVTQVINLVISGQDVVSVTSMTTSPWDLSSTDFGNPVFGQTTGGSFGFNPPDGQLQNWNLLPVLTSDGFGLNLNSTNGLIPMTFQAVRNAGPACHGNPGGDGGVAQRLVYEALGIQPAIMDVNGDGVVNIEDIQNLIDAALGCGTPGTIQVRQKGLVSMARASLLSLPTSSRSPTCPVPAPLPGSCPAWL